MTADCRSFMVQEFEELVWIKMFWNNKCNFSCMRNEKEEESGIMRSSLKCSCLQRKKKKRLIVLDSFNFFLTVSASEEAVSKISQR